MKDFKTILEENRAFAESTFDKLNKKTLQMAIRSRWLLHSSCDS